MSSELRKRNVEPKSASKDTGAGEKKTAKTAKPAASSENAGFEAK